MATCKNKGCDGHARRGQFFCYACYLNWSAGGNAAVVAGIAERAKPVPVCVGHEQLAEKDTQIAALHATVAEYAAFQAEVLEVYTHRYMRLVKVPGVVDVLERIRLDAQLAAAARSSCNKSGGWAGVATDRATTTAATAAWLRNIPARLKFREASEHHRRTTEQRAVVPSTLPHPSAKTLDEAEPLRLKVAQLEGRLTLSELRSKRTAARSVIELAGVFGATISVLVAGLILHLHDKVPV